MQGVLLILAVWASYVALVHTVGGQRRVVDPLLAEQATPFARSTLLVVWHLVTVALVTMAAAITLAACVPKLSGLALFAGVQAAGFSVVFVVVARRELGASIRLPQWMLLAPLAVGLFATHAARPAAMAAAMLVAGVALGHVAWAFGVAWPARTRKQLAEHVLPASGPLSNHGRFPGRALTLCVAAALFAMSACLVVPGLVPGGRGPVIAIAAIFGVRGLVGLAVAERSSDGVIPATPFFLYNRFMYSPACLLIAALAAASTSAPA